MSADQYNSERALGKKVQWDALIVHRHQHAGGHLDGSTFQAEAGASHLVTGSGDADGIPDFKAAGDGAAGEQTSPHFAAIIPASAPYAAVGSSNIQRSRQRQLSPAVAPAPNNRKSIAQRQTRAAAGTLMIEKGVVESTAVSSGRGRRAGFPLTVRSTGTKDRHSKVRTAKGLRDRRVRLSAATAIQFFDVQDRLGYDQPSKAVDWLINNARAAIDELGPVQGVIVGDGEVAAAGHAAGKETEEGRYRDRDNPSIKVKEEEQRSSGGGVIAAVGSSGRLELRVKARERARERAKEKSTPAGTEPTASVTTVAQAPPQPSRPSSPNLEEILLSQLRQHNSQPPQFDQRHQRPHHHLSRSLQLSDYSPFAIYPQTTSNSATQTLPLASHFYPIAAPPPPTSRVPFVYNDVPPLQSFSFISAPQIYHTPISPRGTLQSIFSNSVSSVPQVPMPLHVMGQRGYGAAPGQGGNGGCYHGAADVASPDLRQNSRIPLRFHDMELDPQEETRMPSSSMADFQ